MRTSWSKRSWNTAGCVVPAWWMWCQELHGKKFSEEIWFCSSKRPGFMLAIISIWRHHHWDASIPSSNQPESKHTPIWPTPQLHFHPSSQPAPAKEQPDWSVHPTRPSTTSYPTYLHATTSRRTSPMLIMDIRGTRESGGCPRGVMVEELRLRVLETTKV